MKIFVSSTYEDLKEYRLAVRDVILRMRHQPVMMEDFGAQPEEPKVAALEELAQCEAFVGIYAHRYGTVPKGDTRSVTEQEFDYARAKGIPCFCYRVDPEHPWPPRFIDKGGPKKKLDSFLKKVDQLLRSMFTDPNDLAKKVAADLGRELAKEIVPEPLSARYSLPSPPADFTGRKSQVDQLLKGLAAGKGVAISGLTGMGGIGKTVLGLVVAHRLADRYTDAQIFLDLKGNTPTPLTSAEVMRYIIHAFKPEADLRQATEAELAGLYLSTLHGKRALLLMDNAKDDVQVKPLLPPPGCALLVTSRRYFTVPGLQPVRLDVMAEQEAREFLLTLSPRIDGHADAIAQLCGYLPLALRIAGSTLTERIDLPPADYAAHLADPDRRKRLGLLKSEGDPELDVEAAFALSYKLLSPDVQALWRALAVFPAPFDWLAAAEVWALDDEDKSRQVLSELVRYSLVDYDETSERHSLHDLLSDFANARLTEEEWNTAQMRHAQHFLKVAGAADYLYLEGGEGVLKGLALFDAEWPHIREGQAWAAANIETSEEATRLCKDYPGVAAYCLALRLHRREWVAWLEAAIVAARRLGDRRGEGAHFGNLGLAYADLGETRKAIEYYEKALAIAQEIGDRRGEGNRLGNLGNAYADLGETRKAIEYYEKALAIAREIGDRRGEGSRLGNLGLAYAALGETRKAIEYYEKALAIAREIGDRRGEGSDLGNLGLAYAALGETRKAIEYHEKALVISQEIGDRRGEGNHLGNLGNAYADLGETRKAIEYYEKALVISQEIGYRRGEGTHLGNLGNAYAALGETRKAIEYLEAALKIFEAIESPYAEKARRRLQELKKQK